MRIVADVNIPFVREAFAAFGEVVAVPETAICPELIEGADCLLVRSVTRVDAALLARCRPRFVGTATAGFDHVDQVYLAEQGIPFAAAPGSNANSVSEYVCASLLRLGVELGFELRGKTLGLVGVGRVGRRLAAKARALGMRLLLNDPPRARAEGAEGFCSVEQLLAWSDVLSLHVPLSKEGPDRTMGLAGEELFAALRPGAIFINTSRGLVVDEAALRDALRDGRVRAAALDVWVGEPAISKETLSLVALGTPHIAGYSMDGKAAGTAMLHAAACRALGLQDTWDPGGLLPEPEVALLRLDARERSEAEVLDELLSEVYDVRADDARLRRVLDLPIEQRGPYFAGLRRSYPPRRELHCTRVEIPGASPELRAAVRGLGFGEARASVARRTRP